jgi:hypothetical protein
MQSKRTLFSAGLVLVSANSLIALPWGIEVRGGGLRFTDSLPQDLYGAWAPEVELEGYLAFSRSWRGWANLNYAWKSGHSLGLGSPTHLNLASLSLGAKLVSAFENSPVQAYLGVGFSAGWLRTHDEACCLENHMTRWSPGCVAKSGLLFELCNHFFSDLFLDYSYQPFSTDQVRDSSHVDLGGLRVGLGIGVHF